MTVFFTFFKILGAFPFALHDASSLTGTSKLRLLGIVIENLSHRLGRNLKNRFVAAKWSNNFLQEPSAMNLLDGRQNPSVDGKAAHIIIPTKDKAELLEKCLHSIIRYSSGWKLQITVVDNASHLYETQVLLRRFTRDYPFINVLRIDEAFNFSSLNNKAFNENASNLTVFMNNDIEIFDSGWLEDFLRLLSQEDVGIVGQKLVFPDMKIQHLGVKLGMGFVAGHPFYLRPINDKTLKPVIDSVNEVSAVTGACLAIRSNLFKEIGGFDENLPVGFNDIDLCLRIRSMGLKILLTSGIKMTHHESQTRGKIRTFIQIRMAILETLYMLNKHGSILRDDQFIS